MKKLILLVLIGMFLTSCEDYVPTDQRKAPVNYTTQTVNEFNKLKEPVILFAKSKRLGAYGVTLKDGNGKLHTFGNLSTLANDIADSYEVGDVLKGDDETSY